jgi:hypothetical protein
MAARAGIEPGQMFCPSWGISLLTNSYGNQETALKGKCGAPIGELFTCYAPEIAQFGARTFRGDAVSETRAPRAGLSL